jgi:hypothetical protein
VVCPAGLASRRSPARQDRLDFEEAATADECRVPTFVADIVVDDPLGVVGVVQNLEQVLGRDRSFGLLGRRPRRQALVGQVSG